MKLTTLILTLLLATQPPTLIDAARPSSVLSMDRSPDATLPGQDGVAAGPENPPAAALHPASLRDGREGVISHMGTGFPADYLALPIGPGHAVHICGTLGCLDLTSTDAGPNHDSLVAGRIADVSVELFSRLCGSPSIGTCRGWWRTSAAGPTLPPTDTSEGETP